MPRRVEDRLFRDESEAQDYADSAKGQAGYSETYVTAFVATRLQSRDDPSKSIPGWKVTTETYYG
jgi:hypothetical protein